MPLHAVTCRYIKQASAQAKMLQEGEQRSKEREQSEAAKAAGCEAQVRRRTVRNV